MEAKSQSGRRFLHLTAALTGVLIGCKPTRTVEEAEPTSLGSALSPYGQRSPSEKIARLPRFGKSPEIGSSRTPLQDSCGIITPASLHFERHHSGVPRIDPAAHRLLIHGMVERPLILTLEDLRRLPLVSRIHFIECAGNSGSEWGPKLAADAQKAHGLASCSEWTGVPLSILLAEAGVQFGATWIVAEGADACHMQRSVPMKKATGDALVVFGQNGEAIRPEQGYPLRLLVPGFEGNMNVKWLRRIKVVDQPYMTKDETSKYTDLMADGTARQFTFEMDAKSLITSPSGGQKLAGPGFCEITGLAWSGRGRIERGEVSCDGGKTWHN